LLEAKRDIVLVDNDYLSGMDPIRGTLPLSDDAAVADPPASEAHFQLLGGMSSSQLIELYSVSKVVVDLYVPGFERIVQEAALFGCLPVMALLYNGRDRADFDLPSDLFFNPMSMEDQARAVRFAMNNYVSLVQSPPLVRFRAFVRSLEAGQQRTLHSLMSSRRVTVLTRVSRRFIH
jgi:hypothetical protein